MTSLLLLSSSTVHGEGYLDHAESELRDFFGAGAEILFVPHALNDVASHSTRARERFTRMGLRFFSLSEPGSESRISSTDAFFVGGGNAFRLLKILRDRGWLDGIRSRVNSGALYAGASAGTNLACPSIRTTNDMPIVEPGSLSALALLPFQINPHYADADPSSTHQGETRDERLRQFHEEPENERPVLALREGAILRRHDDRLDLRGQAGARLFRKGRAAREITPHANLAELLIENT